MDMGSEVADWPEANLRDVLWFLRGSTLLDMPLEWKAAFPKRI